MNKKSLLALTGLLTLGITPAVVSCSGISSLIAKARGFDMSKFPGLDKVAESQDEMMQMYSQSSKLIVQSRLSAMDALVLDAKAAAANAKAGELYDRAMAIAKKGEESQRKLADQLETLQNKPDIDACQTVLETSKEYDQQIIDGNNELAAIAAGTNAEISKTNEGARQQVIQAMQHLADASTKISKSHSLLKDAQKEEIKLATIAVAHSAALTKALESADNLDKVSIASEFRPIIYFITGLPDEFEAQSNIRTMWEEHAAKSNIKLNTEKIASIKAITAKAQQQLNKAFDTSSISF